MPRLYYPRTLGGGASSVVTVTETEYETVEVPVSSVTHAENPAFGWETRTGRAIKCQVIFMPRHTGDGETGITVEHAQQYQEKATTIAQAGIEIQGNEETYKLPTSELGSRNVKNRDLLIVEGVRKRVVGTLPMRNGVFRTHQSVVVRAEL